MSTSNISRARKAKTGGKAPLAPCPTCGIAPDPEGKPFSITFEQPDVVDEIRPELLDTWGADPFLAIEDVGFFIRVILPVKLTDGYGVHVGTWLEIHSEDFRKAWQVWNFPEYKDLEIEGFVDNVLAPWGRLPHALVKATVRDMRDVPFLSSSDNEAYSRILTDTWPHDDVLKPYAELFRSDPPTGQ